MTDDDTPPGETSSGADQPGTDSDERSDTRGLSPFSWDAWLDALRTRVQEQIAVWPESVTETIDLVDRRTSSDVPADGDILVYVHGYLGEGRLRGMNISGTHQAAALGQALDDEFESVDTSPPTVVAATWNSSTTWPRATRRAVAAGETLAQWVKTNADSYDRVTVVGHSLGSRVVLTALARLDRAVVDSVGLLGAAVSPEAVCTEFRNGIESAVDGWVYNYHSRNDSVICRLYSFRERSPGVGCTGTGPASGAEMEPVPTNYADVDVSESVHRHMDYFKPRFEAEVGNCVGELVERQLCADASIEPE